ncbi:MAG TPA: hypothetical protein EYQ69_09345, partial [Gemmatimonadetes bacterium]|nr:hypothetical protein [Gemmatimonadota bacterium]
MERERRFLTWAQGRCEQGYLSVMAMEIRWGDKIIKVDTMTVAGIGFTNKDVLRTLKGDKGTHVQLFIQRKHVDRLLEFNVIRDEIPITSIDVSYMVDELVGYI